jgi:hypothetical protein
MKYFPTYAEVEPISRSVCSLHLPLKCKLSKNFELLLYYLIATILLNYLFLNFLSRHTEHAGSSKILVKNLVGRQL